jgi:hypothetical protein
MIKSYQLRYIRRLKPIYCGVSYATKELVILRQKQKVVNFFGVVNMHMSDPIYFERNPCVTPKMTGNKKGLSR